MEKEITTKAELDTFLEELPEGTLANRTGEDGNFDDAIFTLPDGSTVTVVYTGE